MAVEVIDNVLEDIRVGMEVNKHFSRELCRVNWTKYK